MRIAVAALALVFACSTLPAEAGLFGRGNKKQERKRMPKPADWPRFQPKIHEEHKLGKRNGQHPPDFMSSVAVSAAERA